MRHTFEPVIALGMVRVLPATATRPSPSATCSTAKRNQARLTPDWASDATATVVDQFFPRFTSCRRQLRNVAGATLRLLQPVYHPMAERFSLRDAQDCHADLVTVTAGGNSAILGTKLIGFFIQGNFSLRACFEAGAGWGLQGQVRSGFNPVVIPQDSH